MRWVIGRSGKALIVLACVAYQVLVHYWVISPQVGALRAVLVWLPLAVLAVWVAARARNKAMWLAGLCALGVIVYLAENQERLGLAVVSGLSHATAYLFLLWYFGRTLARGREPIITVYARRVLGALPAEMERYTRALTIAWCVFSVGQLVASMLLFAFASLEAWSAFVNLLNLPLLAIMFVGQRIYRNVRHPDFPRATTWQAIEAFTKDASLSGGAELR